MAHRIQVHGSGSRRLLPSVFTLVAFASAGCGGAAQSGPSRDEQAPAEPSEAGLAGAEPPGMPPACRGVVGSGGTLSIEVGNQRELDALAGCSTISGDLTIQPFEGVNLRALASLRTVQGTLTLGSLYDEHPASGFPSLEGLEQLEEVAGLSLRGVLAPSLRALSNLSRFVPFAAESAPLLPGFLFIEYCPELTDLEGLGKLEGLRGVVLKNDAKLTSMRGIQIPEVMDELEVWDSPLEDLGAISRLTEVRTTLWFMHTALKSAAGLEHVARVDQLQFLGNSALEDVSALSGLTDVRYLNLIENARLAQLPALDGLRSLTGLLVTDNALLREIPRLSITDWREASIERNASLERILAGSNVTRAYQLLVADNPRLNFLDLSQLQEVSEVWVTKNPTLDDTALRRLEELGSGTVRIAGNLGQTLPLTKCPWPGDGVCDEAQTNPYGVCAEGTDPDCVVAEE
jgi:hypothetical protein